jgi:alkylhydroperoxidase/carboxymuconolactone decarboxylase family protein YurZ
MGVDHREILRRLAMGDTSFLRSGQGGDSAESSLDARACAFARLGAAVAVADGSSAFQDPVEGALLAGASEGEIVDVLVAVAPWVGLTRVVSVAPALGLAIGYDVDGALERLDPTEGGT